MKYSGLTAVTVILLLAFLPACGRKTSLIPPQKLIPVAITDLRYVLHETGVTLKWSYPTKMENGDELQSIESFEVYRAAIPEEKYCEGCPVQYEEPVEINGGKLPPAGGSMTAVYTEGYLQSGFRYLYKVRSRAGWWYPSSDSNVVTFVWNIPPKVPHGLQLETTDRAVTLSWQPVEENMQGDALLQKPAYEIYRKSGDADFVLIGEPLQNTEFVDTGLENEKLYSYRVRALTGSGETLQAGGLSKAISGMPSDLTPPPKPQNLVVIALPVGIKLAWQAVDSADLAGYRVYRREDGSTEQELIAELGPDQNQYIDQQVPGGGKWFYSVSSFDAAKQVNESQPCEEEVIETD